MTVTDDRAHRARVLAALGDEHRLAVVDLLHVQDLSPDVLAAELDIAGNLLSHHLKVLEAAGVVARAHSQGDRRRTYVRIVEGALDGLLPLPRVITAPRILFVCTHNSARSVLAEALWRTSSDVPCASAGTHPADRVHPRARKAAQRHGLTIGQQAPQFLDQVLRRDDVVVSVCDSVNEGLGDIANVRVHWSIADPARADTDAAFAATVDELEHRIAQLAPRVRYPRRQAE
jgi:protein-tyrosine-phosphatase/DNA-binding HxlR family transcriptional regulator